MSTVSYATIGINSVFNCDVSDCAVLKYDIRFLNLVRHEFLHVCLHVHLHI